MELENVIESIVDKKVNAMNFDEVMNGIFHGGKWTRVSGETYDQLRDAADKALTDIISQMDREELYKVLKSNYYGFEGACSRLADFGRKYAVIGVRGDTYAIESCSWERADSWEDWLKKGREVLKSRLVDEYKEKVTNKVGSILESL